MWRVGLLVFAIGIAAPLAGANNPSEPPRVLPLLQHPMRPDDTGHLSEENRLAIVRDVDGEFVKVVRPLPSVKPGFRLKPDGKVDKKALDEALVRSLPAANPGDTVQITGIEFKSKEILFKINGGSDPHKSWRNRIHLSVGMPWPTAASTRSVDNGPPGLEKIGSTIILVFDGPVPNLSPAQVKQLLAPFLSFRGERSAAQNWVDTIPPKFRAAIQEHKAIVGMNRDMVLAALGRADHKVREFRDDGTQTEDWIYGDPPGITIFVTFIGNQVVRVKQFP